jgi:hypothetical protein
LVDEGAQAVAHASAFGDFTSEQQQRWGLRLAACLGQEGPRIAEAPDLEVGEAPQEMLKGTQDRRSFNLREH